MSGRHSTLRLRGRSDGNARSRRLVILACTMAGILFFLSLQHSSLFGHHDLPKGKTLDWTVSKAVKDDVIDSERGLGNAAAETLQDKVVIALKVDEKEEEKEDDAKDVMEEKDDDGSETGEGHFESLAIGDEATGNEDEASDEEAIDNGILHQVALKSFPVSLVEKHNRASGSLSLILILNPKP